MSYSAVLVATERSLWKSHQILVHRQSPTLETSSEFMSDFQVARPDSPVKPVICLIGHGNNLVESLELGNASDPSADLVASDFHLSVHAVENGRLDAISLLPSRVRW